jgi:hypothetical protein
LKFSSSFARKIAFGLTFRNLVGLHLVDNRFYGDAANEEQNAPVPEPNPHAGPGFQNRFRMQVRGPNDELKHDSGWLYNIMNTYGLASLASRMGTVSGTNTTVTTELVSAMKIGTGTTAATSTDASLVASTGSVTIGWRLGRRPLRAAHSIRPKSDPNASGSA